jgi:integrase
LCLLTGVRSEKARALTWEHVDLMRRRFRCGGRFGPIAPTQHPAGLAVPGNGRAALGMAGKARSRRAISAPASRRAVLARAAATNLSIVVPAHGGWRKEGG